MTETNQLSNKLLYIVPIENVRRVMKIETKDHKLAEFVPKIVAKATVIKYNYFQFAIKSITNPQFIYQEEFIKYLVKKAHKHSTMAKIVTYDALAMAVEQEKELEFLRAFIPPKMPVSQIRQLMIRITDRATDKNAENNQESVTVLNLRSI